MGHPQLPLTVNEYYELERLKEICQRHGSKDQRTTLDCALLKKQLELESQIKEAAVRAEAARALTERRLQSLAYVTRRINAIQTAGILLQSAIMKASMDYDMILAARASKPVLFDIASTLFLAALPELKVVQKTAKWFLDRKFKIPSSKELQKLSVSQLMERLGTTPQKTGQKAALTTFAQSLDNQAKDIIEAIKDPLAANAEIDENTKMLAQAYNAKNQILSPLLNALRRSLVATILVERICHRFIWWYQGDDLLIGIKTLFENHGLEEDTKYTGKEFDLYTELLLYDMLREYVKNYFQVRMDASYHRDAPQDLPDHVPERYVDGLDEAQRQMIYARFSKVPWNDRSHPPVKSYKDLIEHWGGKRSLGP